MRNQKKCLVRVGLKWKSFFFPSISPTPPQWSTEDEPVPVHFLLRERKRTLSNTSVTFHFQGYLIIFKYYLGIFFSFFFWIKLPAKFRWLFRVSFLSELATHQKTSLSGFIIPWSIPALLTVLETLSNTMQYKGLLFFSGNTRFLLPLIQVIFVWTNHIQSVGTKGENMPVPFREGMGLYVCRPALAVTGFIKIKKNIKIR